MNFSEWPKTTEKFPRITQSKKKKKQLNDDSEEEKSDRTSGEEHKNHNHRNHWHLDYDSKVIELSISCLLNDSFSLTAPTAAVISRESSCSLHWYDSLQGSKRSERKHCYTGPFLKKK